MAKEGEVREMNRTEENYFELKIVGKSTLLEEWEVVDLIYELLEGKAEFKIMFELCDAANKVVYYFYDHGVVEQ